MNNEEQQDNDNNATPPHGNEDLQHNGGGRAFSLATVIDDAKRVCTDPSGFYSSMPKSGGYAEPAIFVAVMAAILGLLMSVFALFGGNYLGSMAISMASVIIMPIMGVIGSFIGALVMFVIWKLMGSTQSYAVSYRCIAYATAIYPVTGLLSIIPYLGTIIGTLWGIYLMYVASIHVHSIKQKTAQIAMGILAAFMVLYQVSTEVAGRKIAAEIERAEQRLERIGTFGQSPEDRDGKPAETVGEVFEAGLAELENLDQMTPEEAGEKLGAFMKQFEEGAKAFEQAYEEGAAGAQDGEQAKE